MTGGTETNGRRRLYTLIHQAAVREVAAEDVWTKYDLPSIPAERVIRHFYNHSIQSWSTEETIVKMEKEPFAHGAMRFCFRMKKLATPPASATNHRFHKFGWARASNYVAKAYIKDGVIDCSIKAKDAVRNDIVLQYESNFWAERFNRASPPKEINFIRAYAIEFPDREGMPWFAVERFISGRDSYGYGFHKHNTNSGYVDLEQHRMTPQIFSAYSFYASSGTRLVADIQGVGDLYTDPQVLSDDYRFGDGDLGPRGMALFFHSFRHCTFSDSMGIPIFPLSRNEIKCQAKYDNEEITLSDDDSVADRKQCKLERIDLNRLRRQSALVTPLDLCQTDDQLATVRRSNLKSREDIRKSLRQSVSTHSVVRINRSKSELDEVSLCLAIAMKDTVFDHHAFHRNVSGEIRERTTSLNPSEGNSSHHQRPLKMAPPMVPNDECRTNLGKVHYQLACLHGLGRFPETIPSEHSSGENSPHHDIYSVIFHLAHAASLYNVPACLALARVQAGLESIVSSLLTSVISVNFDAAKDLLQRAMESTQPPSGPKATAGCLLFQILQDDERATDITRMGVLEDTIALMRTAEYENMELKKHEARIARGGAFHLGDKVKANYALEGEFYPGVIIEMSADRALMVVQFDDDGSTESLTVENIRPIVPPTARANHVSLSDSEAFGVENTDENCILENYILKVELAELKAKCGEMEIAASLFEEGADGAMNAGKMQTATKWSLRAAELQL